MNAAELYEFDRQGYLVIEELLTPDEVASLAEAVDLLEEHAVAHVDEPPRAVLGRDVRGHGSRVAARAVDLVGNASDALQLEVVHHGPGALAGELQGDGLADPPVGAGHEGHLLIE